MHAHANCMAELAPRVPKPLLGVRPDPPHITMEMALHCGARINALEGSWHILQVRGSIHVFTADYSDVSLKHKNSAGLFHQISFPPQVSH